MNKFKESKWCMTIIFILLTIGLYAGSELYNSQVTRRTENHLWPPKNMIAYEIFEADSNNTYIRYDAEQTAVFIRHVYSTAAYGGSVTLNEKAFEVWDRSLLSGYSYEPINY